MGKYKLLFAMCLFLIYSVTAVAQETVSGTVTDAGTGESLPGVNIVIEGLIMVQQPTWMVTMSLLYHH